jgi:hypothetical protein
MLKKALKYYLICCGLALHLGALVTVYFALDYFALTPRQFMVKLAEKSNIDAPALIYFIEPSAQHTDHPFDGKTKPQHPRILLPEISTLSAGSRIKFFKTRNNLYQNGPINAPSLPCNKTHLSALTTCWLATDDPQKFDQALELLLNFKVETPDVSALYGNGWQLALNYDLLSSSSKITNSQHLKIQGKSKASHNQ